MGGREPSRSLTILCGSGAFAKQLQALPGCDSVLTFDALSSQCWNADDMQRLREPLLLMERLSGDLLVVCSRDADRRAIRSHFCDGAARHVDPEEMIVLSRRHGDFETKVVALQTLLNNGS